MTLAFAPLLYGPAVVVVTLLLTLLCWYHKLWWRGLVFMALGLMLLNPLQQQVQRHITPGEIVVITDQSRSTEVYTAEFKAAQNALRSRLAAPEFNHLNQHWLNIADTAARGSTPLEDTLADVKRLGKDISGVVLLTDGMISIPTTPYPAPLHILQLPSTKPDRWVEFTSVPSFALVNKNQQVTFIVHDSQTHEAEVTLTLPEQSPQTLRVPTNQEIQRRFTLSHVGPAAVSIKADPLPQEANPGNNSAATLVNGVRESFSVLLITGSPHNGTRSLRQVLKGDAGVNLVHFSILRTLYSRDDAGRDEMSLIPFPVDQLFGEQLNDFDLVVFDNFITANLGLYEYYADILRYLDQGGSVFVIANPGLNNSDGLMQTPLARAMPFSQVIGTRQQTFVPQLSAKGEKHPVTSPLAYQAKAWGSVKQQVVVGDSVGDVLMTGPDNSALLVLHEVGKGRVATLLTQDLWRWGREAPGGPQTDLLKRVAHWLMRAPALEANQLHLSAIDHHLTLTYQGVDTPQAMQVTLTKPDGSQEAVNLSPPLFSHRFEAPGQGLYKAEAGTLKTYTVVGASQDKEWLSPNTKHTQALAEYAQRSGGRLFTLKHNQLPQLKAVAAGEATSGRQYIGLPPGAETQQIMGESPVLSAWMWLVLLSVLIIVTWAQEAGLFGKIKFTRLGL